MGLDGLTWPRSHPKGPWEPRGGRICLSPAAPQLGLENLHRGARPSLVSSHLLSRQLETARSNGADPATVSPDGLGHIPAPPLPPVSQRAPRLVPAGREPCKRCPCRLHGFLWGFFCGFWLFIRARAAGGRGRTVTPRSHLCASTRSLGAQLAPAHAPASSPTAPAPGGVTAPLKRRRNIPRVFLSL